MARRGQCSMHLDKLQDALSASRLEKRELELAASLRSPLGKILGAAGESI